MVFLIIPKPVALLLNSLDAVVVQEWAAKCHSVIADLPVTLARDADVAAALSAASSQAVIFQSAAPVK